MKIIDDPRDFVDGKYYLCYEDQGSKAIFIGTLRLYDYDAREDIGELDGTWYSRGAEQEGISWLLYRNFNDDSIIPKRVQWVFELSETEILTHIISENI